MKVADFEKDDDSNAHIDFITAAAVSQQIDLINFIILRSAQGRLSRDRMAIGFTTTYAVSAYHH